MDISNDWTIVSDPQRFLFPFPTADAEASSIEGNIRSKKDICLIGYSEDIRDPGKYVNQVWNMKTL